MSKLEAVPMFRDDALAFLERHHRTHDRPEGYIFAVGAAVGDEVVGVAIVGRPKGYRLQDGWCAEVVRLCTNGHKNACSFLYGASWLAARALGYKRLVTYTLPEEGGASLRASGWRIVAQTRGVRTSYSWVAPEHSLEGKVRARRSKIVHDERAARDSRV